MELLITELMGGYIDDEFWPSDLEDPGFSVERIKELTMTKIHAASTGASARHIHKLGRTLLIAATISLAFIATALAVYRFTMRDVTIGEPYTLDTPVSETKTYEQTERVDISMNGLVDSPEYQAYVEWSTWNNAWLTDHSGIFDELGVDDSYYETPDNYAFYYQAFFTEQADALDALAEKYGLTLHTARNWGCSEDELCRLLGVDDVFSDELHGSAVYVYEDGSFRADGSMGDYLDWTMFFAVKGTFSMIGSSIPTDCETWDYTTADGTDVLLIIAQTPNPYSGTETWQRGEIIANLDGAYATVSFSSGADRESLQRWADEINFSNLNKRFSSGADTSEIAAGVTESLERQRAEAAERAQAEWAPYTSREEMTEAVFAELGEYDIELPDGWQPVRREANQKEQKLTPVWDMENSGVCWERTYKNYSDNSIGTLGLMCVRCYDADDLTTVRNAEQFPLAKEFYAQEEGNAGSCTVNGYEAILTWESSGIAHRVTWYDTDRELIFSLFEANVFYQYGENTEGGTQFSTEEFLALAESVR